MDKAIKRLKNAIKRLKIDIFKRTNICYNVNSKTNKYRQ